MSIAAPAVINDHDSAKYKTNFTEDPAIGFDAEDSGQITRPRYTRAPSREHALGFTFVSDADKQAIENLWLNARGGSDIVTGFLNPVSGAAINVRFKRGTVPSFVYRGKGGAHYWDISNIIFVEV